MLFPTKKEKSIYSSTGRPRNLIKQRQYLTEIEIQYAIDECQWWAKQALKEAQISAVEGVFLADNVVSDDLRLKLSSGLKRLENVPNDQKDWHPRSDNQVRISYIPRSSLSSAEGHVSFQEIGCSPTRNS